MLHGHTWPQFICPNCRATADLDAEVDEPVDEWQQLPEDVSEKKTEGETAQESNADQGDPGDITVHFNSAAMPPPPVHPLRHVASDPVPIPNASQRRTPSPPGNPLINHREGPITPRNDVGPWVFDGNPERISQENTRRSGMVSLNAAAQAGQTGPNPI
jgi:hypothetical protein